MASNANRSTKVLVLATLFIVFVLSLIFVLINKENTEIQHIQFETPPPIENQPTLGNNDAPVTIVEFGDYKCPACKAWDDSIFPKLREEYIDKGTVKFSYINTLFHGEESFLAALASEAVWNQNPEDFWIFHKEIYNQQPPSQYHDEKWITPKKLLEIAVSLDLEIDFEQLAKDMVNQTYIEDVLLDQQLVEEYDVSLTPTIFINGTMLEDPFNYEEIVRLLEEALKEQKQ